MRKKHAIAVKAAANKYYGIQLTNFSDNFQMIDIAKHDYEDLLSIAQMIECNASKDDVSRAIGSLDTFVQLYIPDSVYSTFVK